MDKKAFYEKSVEKQLRVIETKLTNAGIGYCFFIHFPGDDDALYMSDFPLPGQESIDITFFRDQDAEVSVTPDVTYLHSMQVVEGSAEDGFAGTGVDFQAMQQDGET